MSSAYVSYFTLRPSPLVAWRRNATAVHRHPPPFLAGGRMVGAGLDKKRRGYDWRCRLSALPPRLLFRVSVAGLTHLSRLRLANDQRCDLPRFQTSVA